MSGTDLQQDRGALVAELQARAEALRDAAIGAGAQQAEVYAVRAEGVGVEFEQGDLKLTQVEDGTSLGVRVFKDGRLGFASTNQGSPEALAQTARDALALCALNPPDDANRLPETRPEAPALDLIDGTLDAYGVDEVVELGAELLRKSRRGDDRLSVDKASVDLTRASHCVVNSEGVARTESDVILGTSVFGMAVDGDDVGGFHYTGDNLRTANGVHESIAASADEFADVALGNLGAGTGESYKGPVLFSPDAVLSLFVSPVVSAAGAVAVQRGRSALAGKLERAIASPAITIVDDPFDLALVGASTFDREGQPVARFPIVEEGVLRGFLYNGYAAAVEGRASTGHAVGSARSVPGLGPHALSVAPGDGGSRDDLTASLGKGLYVMRFSGTVDPASGDFSGVAKSARWIEGGRVVRSLREVLISGNAFELLGRVVALSSEAERLHGSARVPAAIVDGVSVTAG